MTEMEPKPENLRAIVDNMKKYRRRFLILGCITIALLVIHTIAVPYLKAYCSRTFHMWPSIIAYLTLRIPAFILGTLCVLSAVSAMWGIAVKNDPLRRAILYFGIVLSALYVYSCCATFINALPYPPGTLWAIRLSPFLHPVLFIIPVCITYLGAVKPPRSSAREDLFQ